VSWRDQLKVLEEKCEKTRKALSAAEDAFRSATAAQVGTGDRLEAAHAASPLLTALAQLREYGVRLGLQDGHCPLCGSPISMSAFDAHLNHIQVEIDRHNKSLTELTALEVSWTADYAKRRDDFHALSLEYSRALSDFETLKTAMQGLQAQAAGLKIDLTSEGIESALKESRAREREIDAGLVELEGSTAFDRIADLEKQRSLAQHDADVIARQMDLLSVAAKNAKTAADMTRRVSWEAVDDCLAALSPLLSELFLRFRPHVDYSEVKYRMRGDVKRFLSFAVGNGINPRFTFSSGQRRALGLAFLLAVHLSRPWCNLRTPVLDDPVQHIDDYRALHLAEVLSSIRQMGHQVICTVEDSALADLLCRRLRSAASGDGIRIELVHEPGIGLTVRAIKPIGPMPEKVLLSA
jgi:DNA repair exonuclease SbcCD ATPase subunit